MTVRPTLPSRVVAPITAIDWGSNMQPSPECRFMIDSMHSTPIFAHFLFCLERPDMFSQSSNASCYLGCVQSAGRFEFFTPNGHFGWAMCG